MTPPITPSGTPPASKKMAIVWIVVAVVVLAALAWYYFAYYTPLPAPPSGPDEATTQLESQGASDETSAIEQDLKATDLSDLDRELSDIDAQLAE